MSCRLEEPGEFARGGFSPLVKGLPIERYKEIAPIKIGLVETSELTYTDLPGDYKLVDRLRKIWQESISNALTKTKWKIPRVSPPVINGAGYILDGNHRSAAASLHSPKMNAILIENQKDLDALNKLVRAEVLFWPHGSLSYKKLEAKLKNVGQSLSYEDYISELNDLRTEEYEEAEESSRLNDFQKERLLTYFVSRVIHQAGAYLNRQSSLAWETSTRIRGLEPYLRTDGYNVDIVDFKIDETYRQVREIAKRSPLVKKNSLFSIDDVAQEVLCILMPHLDK